MKQGWKYLPIGEVADVTDFVANGSFATLRDNVQYHTEPSYAVLVRVVDFSSDFDKTKFVYVDKHGYDFLEKSSLQGGEIIMSNVGSIGKEFICPDLGMPMTLGPNAIVIRTDNNKYYYYCFFSEWFQNLLKGISGRGGLIKFNKTNFKQLVIPVPPRDVQDKIVEELDQINALISIKEKQLRELEELEQTIFHEMFGDPVINDKKWSLQQLNSFAKVKGRVGWKGYKKTDLREDGPYVIGATHLAKDGTIDLTAPVFISREKYEESPEIYIERGDVIIAQRGSIGKVGLVEEEIGEATINPCVLIVRPENIDGQYLLGYFLHEHMQHELIMMSTGGVQPMITQKQLNELMVPYPDLEFQEAYHQKILVIKERKIELLKSKNDLEELLASRMQYWFD